MLPRTLMPCLAVFCALAAGCSSLAGVQKPSASVTSMNLGQVAGAGIADHLHLHLVPRWGGDTNFMPVTADTRVLPEALEATYDRVVAALTP
jgi:ATP adenylyltransferase